MGAAPSRRVKGGIKVRSPAAGKSCSVTIGALHRVPALYSARMAIREESQTPVFQQITSFVGEEVGVTGVLGASDFRDLARALAPELPFQGTDDLGQLLEEAAAADQPVLLLPPWGRQSGLDQGWQLWSPPGSSALLVVPSSDLARVLPQRTRRSGSPSLVVVGRIQFHGFHADLEAALVVFNTASAAEITRFFTIPQDGDPHVVMSDFRRLLTREGGATQFGFVVRDQDLTGQSWRPQDHDPAIHDSIRDLAAFGSGGVVNDVFEILRPMLLRGGEVPVRSEGRIILGRDLGPEGHLRPLDEDLPGQQGGLSHPTFSSPPLQAGDLLLADIERANRPRPPVEVLEEDLPAVVGGSVVALRARHPLSDQHREFYKYYFGSRRFRKVMRAQPMGGAIRLTRLGEAALPVPDSELVEALADLRRAREAFSFWAQEGVNLTTDAFEGSAAKARSALIEQGRLLRLREEAARAVGSFDHRVANFYPTPIAAQFREVRVRQSAGNDRDTYQAILNCCETALAFCACVALAFAWANKKPVGALAEIRKKLSHGRTGVSMGDWANVLKEVSSAKAFRGIADDAPLAAIRSALPEGSPAAKAQERLKNRRDDESHQRRVDDLDLPGAVVEAMADLEVLLEHLGFLADMPIFQVDSTEWDSIRGEGRAKVRWLRGDHPVSLIEPLNHADSGLEQGSLYMRDLNGLHVLLRPFMVRVQCVECHTWSTFYPDHRRERQVRLKALDHSHSILAATHLAALEAVGLVEAASPRDNA